MVICEIFLILKIDLLNEGRFFGRLGLRDDLRFCGICFSRILSRFLRRIADLDHRGLALTGDLHIERIEFRIGFRPCRRLRTAREEQRDRRAAAGLAFQLDRSTVELCAVLDDRKAETRSADLLGMALVYAVEALEDPLLIRLRDADAGIRNRENRLLIGAGHLHFDGAVVIVIFDCVVAEIKEHFLDNDRNALHRCAVTLQLHRDAACICGGAELLQNGIRNLIEIERENLLGKALVI